jgi:hypothetical protein
MKKCHHVVKPFSYPNQAHVLRVNSYITKILKIQGSIAARSYVCRKKVGDFPLSYNPLGVHAKRETAQIDDNQVNWGNSFPAEHFQI